MFVQNMLNYQTHASVIVLAYDVKPKGDVGAPCLMVYAYGGNIFILGKGAWVFAGHVQVHFA